MGLLDSLSMTNWLLSIIRDYINRSSWKFSRRALALQIQSETSSFLLVIQLFGQVINDIFTCTCEN
jgi:hypothetical protein